MAIANKTYQTKQHQTDVVTIGKQQNFDHCFRQHYTPLCFFAQSIIHNEEEAKDIVQDCFIKLWDHNSITENANATSSFLYAMVRNRCIDYVRKKKVIAKATAYLQTHSSEDEYFDEIAFAEMVRQVMDHIEQLPVKMGSMLKEYFLHGKRHKQIAKEYSTTPNAVRMHKQRAVKLLREKLLLFF